MAFHSGLRTGRVPTKRVVASSFLSNRSGPGKLLTDRMPFPFDLHPASKVVLGREIAFVADQEIVRLNLRGSLVIFYHLCTSLV